MFEVEAYSKIPYEYKKVGNLFVESLEGARDRYGYFGIF